MRLIMPMAGVGQRFVAAGYACPKPLLPLDGWPLFLRALACYPTVPTLLIVNPTVAHDHRFTSITQGNHVAVVDSMTRGPVETLLATPTGRQWCETMDELLIADCDSLLDRSELMRALYHFRTTGADGGVTVRQTTDPACSYVQVTTGGWITQSAEKEVISDQSSTGPYWFKHGQLFVNAAEEAMNDGIFSVSPVYNYLRKKGLNIQSYPLTSFEHVGTPEAYEEKRARTVWP